MLSTDSQGKKSHQEVCSRRPSLHLHLMKITEKSDVTWKPVRATKSLKMSLVPSKIRNILRSLITLSTPESCTNKQRGVSVESTENSLHLTRPALTLDERPAESSSVSYVLKKYISKRGETSRGSHDKGSKSKSCSCKQEQPHAPHFICVGRCTLCRGACRNKTRVETCRARLI